MTFLKLQTPSSVFCGRNAITQPVASLHDTIAFTLLELLVTIGVVGIVFAILLTAINNGKAKAARLICLNNLRQISLGSQIYSQESVNGEFTGTLSDGDDDFNWLVASSVKDFRVYICPATKNTLTPVVQPNSCGILEYVFLKDNAPNRGVSIGTSYEVFGFMGRFSGQRSLIKTCDGIIDTPGIRKTSENVQVYQHQNNSFGLSGVIPGPSAIWLFLDADDINYPNFPGADGNHGSSGANVGFADGHVAWIKRSQYAFEYELSQDEGRAK